MNIKYPGCWYCDNILEYPDQVGLLHLGFPRCFVLMKQKADFFLCRDFHQWCSMIAEINWLDPNDQGTPQEQEQVLTNLWNFAIESEEREEELYGEYLDDNF